MLEDLMKKMKKEILLIEEEAYKKGFAHGFEVGLKKSTTREKIRKWRYSDDLYIMGAPGTAYEDKILADLNEYEEAPKDALAYQRMVYEEMLKKGNKE